MNDVSAYEVVQETVLVLLPELVLVVGAISIMAGSVFIRRPRATWWATSAGALVVSLFVLLGLRGTSTDLYAAVALNDDLAFGARLVLILTGLVLVALAHEEPDDDRAGEFFGALLLVDAGAMLVATANDLVFLFVGLELVSIPTYLLLYLSRRNRMTQEAATKYFFLSIFASGLVLYGLAFLYGTTGLSNLKALTYVTLKLPRVPFPQLGLVAVVFLLAGLCFRVAAVPMHFYAPDVYEGSPMVIAALLAWVPKAVGFLAMVRALTAVFSVKSVDPSNSLLQKAMLISWIIAAATMIWGNVMALLQDNLKRLLAYSSIAHAGYLMVGITVGFVDDLQGGAFYGGNESVFFYLVTYSLMTLGTFAVMLGLWVEDRPVETVEELAGLGWSRPWPALALAVCLLSLSGIPPLFGFWGKLEIFGAALAAEQRFGTGAFLLLAVIGMLSAAVGAYYYLRIVVTMYLRPAARAVAIGGGWPVACAAAFCASLTVILGLFAQPVAGAARSAARAALEHPAPLGLEAAATDPAVPRPFLRLVRD
jgi:NADH-quinone oxidoreductase subunit N